MPASTPAKGRSTPQQAGAAQPVRRSDARIRLSSSPPASEKEAENHRVRRREQNRKQGQRNRSPDRQIRLFQRRKQIQRKRNGQREKQQNERGGFETAPFSESRPDRFHMSGRIPEKRDDMSEKFHAVRRILRFRFRRSLLFCRRFRFGGEVDVGERPVLRGVFLFLPDRRGFFNWKEPGVFHGGPPECAVAGDRSVFPEKAGVFHGLKFSSGKGPEDPAVEFDKVEGHGVSLAFSGQRTG